jgi:hypothetical protein
MSGSYGRVWSHPSGAELRWRIGDAKGTSALWTWKLGRKRAPDRLYQTNADASKTQLVSPVAKPSKWFGGAKLTRLFMSQ